MYLSLVTKVIIRCHGFFNTTPCGYKIHVLYTYYSYPIKAYTIVLHDTWLSCVCALISDNENKIHGSVRPRADTPFQMFIPYSGFLTQNYIFVNCYLAGLYLAPVIQCENMFQLKFISMNNIRSCFIVMHSALLQNHPNSIKSCLAMLFSRNRLATIRMCIKQFESSNNWSRH